jgi:hypothetical protein
MRLGDVLGETFDKVSPHPFKTFQRKGFERSRIIGEKGVVL